MTTSMPFMLSASCHTLSLRIKMMPFISALFVAKFMVQELVRCLLELCPGGLTHILELEAVISLVLLQLSTICQVVLRME